MGIKINGIAKVTGKVKGTAIPAGPWTSPVQEARLTAFTDADAANDNFASVSIGINPAGDAVVIGAKFKNTAGTDGGGAYTYTASGSVWTDRTQLHTVTGGFIQSGGQFGAGIDMDDNGRAVTGNPNYDDGGANNRGRVTFFNKSGTNWTTGTDFAGPAVSDDGFGSAVSVSGFGNRVVVGAPTNDNQNTNAGRAQVYDANTGVLLGTVNPTSEANARFGTRVAMNQFGTTYAVSAPFEGPGAEGKVWVYTGTTSLQETFEETGTIRFGQGLDISNTGDTLVVGDNTGKTYVYERTGSTWGAGTQIVLPDSVVGTRRPSISGDGNTIIIGSSSDDTLDADSGAAYVYVRNGSSWDFASKITPTDLVDTNFFGANFGDSIAINFDGTVAVIGAVGKNIGGLGGVGAAYVFRSE